MKYRGGCRLVDAFYWSSESEPDNGPSWMSFALKAGLVAIEGNGGTAGTLVADEQRACRGCYIVRESDSNLSVWSRWDSCGALCRHLALASRGTADITPRSDRLLTRSRHDKDVYFSRTDFSDSQARASWMLRNVLVASPSPANLAKRRASSPRFGSATIASGPGC